MIIVVSNYNGIQCDCDVYLDSIDKNENIFKASAVMKSV